MRHEGRYYQDMLTQITPDDLLPGVDPFDRLEAAHIQMRWPLPAATLPWCSNGWASRIGWLWWLMVTASRGPSRSRTSSDLRRHAWAVCRDPGGRRCGGGYRRGAAGGMLCLALGPAERFALIEARYGPIPRRDDLNGLQLAEIEAAARRAVTWSVSQNQFNADQQHHMETVFTAGNGYFCSRGSFEEGYPGDHPLTLAHGIFDDIPIVRTGSRQPARLDGPDAHSRWSAFPAGSGRMV